MAKKYRFNKYQKEWLKKLRSGRYKQTRLKLHGDGAYCCLGVGVRACGLPLHHDALQTDADLGNLQEVRDKLRLRGADGLLRTSWRNSGSLTQLNDHGGFTFKEIADFIEAHPEQVFVDAD